MHKSLEHLVEVHKIARDRIAKGLPLWDSRIKIKHLLDEATDIESLSSKSEKIANILKSFIGRKYPEILNEDSDQFDEDIYIVIENLESAKLMLEQHVESGNEAVSLFNSWLSTIYDWTDFHRVWID